MKTLKGKTAVVIGGSDGVGLASARTFADHGAHVFIMGRDQGRLHSATRSIGHGALALRGDVAELGDLDRLYSLVRVAERRIDVLVASVAADLRCDLSEITEADFDRVIGVNMRGTLFAVQKALPLLNPGASIILTDVRSGANLGRGVSVYNASKAASRSFVHTWAGELADRSIRVNLLSLDSSKAASSKATSATAVAKHVDDRLKDSSGFPAGIAQVALFLASEASSSISGSEIAAFDGAVQP